MRLKELQSIDGLFVKARNVGDQIEQIFNDDKQKNLRRKAPDFMNSRTKSINYRTQALMKNTQHYKFNRMMTEYSRSLLTQAGSSIKIPSSEIHKNSNYRMKTEGSESLVAPNF